jgi:membrane associated rhomboid family serine protease
MIIPLWDENPFAKDRWPVVSWTLIGINVAAYAAVSGMSDEAYQVFVERWGLTPALLFHPTGWMSLVTPLTSIFLHANLVHLLSNMLLFWIVGDDVEEVLGRRRFAIFYFACGLLSALAYAVSAPQSTVPEIGASGAIAALLAAYVMFRPCKKITTLLLWFIVRVDAYWIIGIWVLIQFIDIGLSADDGGDSVAYAAHIGGLIAGAALFAAMRPAGVELFQCLDSSKAGADSTVT